MRVLWAWAFSGLVHKWPPRPGHRASIKLLISLEISSQQSAPTTIERGAALAALPAPSPAPELALPAPPEPPAQPSSPPEHPSPLAVEIDRPSKRTRSQILL